MIERSLEARSLTDGTSRRLMEYLMLSCLSPPSSTLPRLCLFSNLPWVLCLCLKRDVTNCHLPALSQSSKICF